MRRRLLALCAAVLAGPAMAADNPDAKVLHMQPFGDWEAWCVKRHAEPRPDCFVANAVVYSPRPDFAAIVLYFRPPGLARDEAHVRLGMEAQSALAPGHVKVDGEDVISTTQCLLPGSCTLSGAAAEALIARFAGGETVDWRHYDYAVTPVDIAMDLDGFAAAYDQTAAWAAALAAQ